MLEYRWLAAAVPLAFPRPGVQSSAMYSTIFVPLDGSEFGARALPVAAAVARRTGASLRLAVVFDPSMFLHFTPGDVTVPSFEQSTIDRYCSAARAWVEEQAASLSNTGLTATGVLLEGTVVEALSEYAQSIEADLVIMTTHGRSGADRLWLGSVAGSFLSRSVAPVFLVRPAGHDAPAPGHEVPTGTLMVPLDGSPFGESVLPHAVAFAEAVGLTLELVMIVIPMSTPLSLFGTEALFGDAFVASDHEEQAHTYLARVAATVTPPPITTVLVEMLPARALIAYARRTHPGAIALATHGRSGLARVVLGSVADKLLRGAEQPLLVFHPIDRVRAPAPAPTQSPSALTSSFTDANANASNAPQ
jgi:nucleotide-binding universal stress UspA family protein